MTTAIAFTKDATLQNILLDEYFAEYDAIAIIAFNYDGAGTALCRCGDRLVEIQKTNLRKIIFGADKEALEEYLHSIFDPEAETDDITRQNGCPVFRLQELRGMKKYDVTNLAKKTLQEVQAMAADPFRYFIKTDETPAGNKRQHKS